MIRSVVFLVLLGFAFTGAVSPIAAQDPCHPLDPECCDEGDPECEPPEPECRQCDISEAGPPLMFCYEVSAGYMGCNTPDEETCSNIPFAQCPSEGLVIAPSGVVAVEAKLVAADDTLIGGCGNWIVGIRASHEDRALQVSMSNPTQRPTPSVLRL